MNAAKYPRLNDRQYRRVLENIASQADIISRLAFESAERLSENGEDLGLYALAGLARTIGALADEASGGVFRGGILEWECGYPFFDSEGGAS